MTAAVVGAAALLGLLVGSFLNVVIWRVPRGESVVSPPSACPACGHRVRPRDNVPVLSWLLLRGRCRDCSAPISPRYPAVELLTGVLFALTALRSGASWELPAFLYLAAICVALTWIDVDVRRLPDAIVLPSYPVLAVMLTGAAALSGDWGPLLRAAVGGVVLWAFYLLLWRIKPGGMGYGDVKLAGLLGAGLAWVGYGSLAVGAFAAFLLGGVFSIVLLLAGRAGRKSRIPFGPWMIAGAVLGVAAGEQLAAAYLTLLV